MARDTPEEEYVHKIYQGQARYQQTKIDVNARKKGELGVFIDDRKFTLGRPI